MPKDDDVDDLDSIEDEDEMSSTNSESFESKTERDEVKEVQKMSQKDTSRVIFWRTAVTVVLLLTAVAVTLTTYKLLKKAQNDDVETAVRTAISKIDGNYSNSTGLNIEYLTHQTCYDPNYVLSAFTVPAVFSCSWRRGDCAAAGYSPGLPPVRQYRLRICSNKQQDVAFCHDSFVSVLRGTHAHPERNGTLQHVYARGAQESRALCQLHNGEPRVLGQGRTYGPLWESRSPQPNWLPPVHFQLVERYGVLAGCRSRLLLLCLAYGKHGEGY